MVANLLAPIASALFANSAVQAGSKSGYKSIRRHIWNTLDRYRTGVPGADSYSKSMTKNDLVDRYLDFALKAPLIYIRQLPSKVWPADITFQSWLEQPLQDWSPGLEDFAHHLSLLFPEVRPKGYLELRSIDVPPIHSQMVPVLFYAGLLYSQKALEKALEFLLPGAKETGALLQEAAFGLRSDALYKMAIQIMQLALTGLEELTESFSSAKDLTALERFYEQYVLQRKVFADDSLADLPLYKDE